MIRTRNFILYILCLFFLGLAMTVSLTYYAPHQEESTPTLSLATSSAVAPLGASAPTSTVDRAANLDRLLAAIKASPEVVTPHPSVPNDVIVGGPISIDGTTASNTTTASPVKLIACPYPDDSIAYVPQWPVYDVAVANREGARIVYTSTPAPGQGTATSSATSTAPLVKTLLQLPVSPQKAASPNCVPSTVVGVTTQGRLIFNRDIAAYRDASADTLIGYARDGFPIYGMYTGPTDKCGGYESPTGYRYTLAPDRKFILGCFVGKPRSFNF